MQENAVLIVGADNIIQDKQNLEQSNQDPQQGKGFIRRFGALREVYDDLHLRFTTRDRAFGILELKFANLQQEYRVLQQEYGFLQQSHQTLKKDLRKSLESQEDMQNMLKILDKENENLYESSAICQQSYETVYKDLRKTNDNQDLEIQRLKLELKEQDLEIQRLKLQLEEQESQQKIGSEFYRIAQEKIKRDVSNTLWH